MALFQIEWPVLKRMQAVEVLMKSCSHRERIPMLVLSLASQKPELFDCKPFVDWVSSEKQTAILSQIQLRFCSRKGRMLKEIQPSPLINTSTLSSSIYVTMILNYYHMSVHVLALPPLKEAALCLVDQLFSSPLLWVGKTI